MTVWVGPGPLFYKDNLYNEFQVYPQKESLFGLNYKPFGYICFSIDRDDDFDF